MKFKVGDKVICRHKPQLTGEECLIGFTELMESLVGEVMTVVEVLSGLPVQCYIMEEGFTWCERWLDPFDVGEPESRTPFSACGPYGDYRAEYNGNGQWRILAIDRFRGLYLADSREDAIKKARQLAGTIREC